MRGLALAGLLLAHAAIHGPTSRRGRAWRRAGRRGGLTLTAAWLLGSLGIDAAIAHLIGRSLSSLGA